MLEVVPTRLRRNQAAEYLRSRHGLPCAPATLAKLAVLGGGPRFHKPGARTVLYDAAELDRWASEKLGRPRASTSDTLA
jgi:hypothetical protein